MHSKAPAPNMSPQRDLDDANLERSRSGGIYSIRDLRHNARSFDKRSVEVADGSQKLEVQERDIRRKQVSFQPRHQALPDVAHNQDRSSVAGSCLGSIAPLCP